MWLFTRHGFFSVTNARQDRGAGSLDPDRLQVRARSRKHLENLIEQFDVLSGDAVSDIIETPKADYLFRIIVSREAWVIVAGALAAEIAYPNFKNECYNRPELEDAYLSTLHEVWGEANDLQGRLHGKGAYVWPHPDEDEDDAAFDDLPLYIPDMPLFDEPPDDQPKETADAS